MTLDLNTIRPYSTTPSWRRVPEFVLAFGLALFVTEGAADPIPVALSDQSSAPEVWGSVEPSYANLFADVTVSSLSPSSSSSTASPEFHEAPEDVLHLSDQHPTAPAASGASSGLEFLVPELEGNTWSVSDGPRKFAGRLNFSPAYGRLGEKKFFAFRLGYNPNSWLGYEAAIGHNPGDAVHALFNTLNAVVRYPMPFRFQPYCTVGFGMVIAFPGEALNADSVTKNTYAVGAGLEVYVRDDVAIRGEVRRTGVLGAQPFEDETVVFSYGEATVGLSFYRTLNH